MIHFIAIFSGLELNPQHLHGVLVYTYMDLYVMFSEDIQETVTLVRKPDREQNGKPAREQGVFSEF